MNASVSGILQCLPQGGGFLRSMKYSFQPGPEDVFVSQTLIRQYALCDGADVSGTAQPDPRCQQLVEVSLVNGLSPEDWKQRMPMEKLEAISPQHRIDLGAAGHESMRVFDLVAPLGMGARALVVAPPRTGKTTLIEQLAGATARELPEAQVVVLLIDERPEEVTDFRRNVPATVLASSMDESGEKQLNLVEMTMAWARCQLECGRDVVILVDSLTRMARLFNRTGPGSRKTLSGGIDARALEVPRKFFGMARQIDGGGSVTIVATALIDTGSRMDEYVFQEFKGTGNCEVVLSRDLADRRCYPAIDIQASGTRRDERLYDDASLDALNRLRRVLISSDPHSAMTALLKQVAQSADNMTLLKEVAAM